MSVVVIEGESDPAKRLRADWGQSLDEHLDARNMSRKELVERLKALGYEVSVQAVGQWVRGETSPRPHMQGAVATVLGVPARRLFPVERVA